MGLIPVLCPHCHSDHVIKGGKTKAGQQRSKCQHTACPHSRFQRDLFSKGRAPAIKEPSVDMRLNGSGIRDTARVLKMSPTTVINTLKKKSRRSARSINRCSTPCLLTMETGCASELRKRTSMRGGPLWGRSTRSAGGGMRSITRRARGWRRSVAGGTIRCVSSSKRCSSLLASSAMTPMLGARPPGSSIPTSTSRASGTCSRSSANIEPDGPGASVEPARRSAFPDRSRCMTSSLGCLSIAMSLGYWCETVKCQSAT